MHVGAGEAEEDFVWFEAGLWLDAKQRARIRDHASGYAAAYDDLLAKGHANQFHMQWHQHDPLRELSVSVELGWSTFSQPMPFRLAAWDTEESACATHSTSHHNPMI